MLSASFALAQNDSVYFAAYPNPFQKQLSIDVDSLNNDTVSLKLFNMTGQVVSEPLTQMVLSNSLSLVYDGDTLPEGVYLLRLSINQENKALKVLKINNVGLTEQKGLADTQVFPNPASSQITIRFGELSAETIEVTDLQGKMIMTQSVSDELLQLDISGLAKGHYFIHLVKGSDVSVRHLIKL